MAFPEDFNWSDQNILKNVRAKVHKKIPEDIALMDGGIYDNQGIESLWLADKRNGFLLDLFIISDLDQQPAILYRFPPYPCLKVSNLTLQGVNWLSKILIIFCFLTLVTVGYKTTKDFISGQFIWLDIF